MALQSGVRLGGYEIVSLLGSGGMGEVYRARDSRLQRDVAIKVLSGSVQAEPNAVARFEREARAVAALNHPHVVTIHGVEESDGRVFLVMELVDGATLDALIPPRGLPLDALLKYAIPLADALSAAHAQGIVHRDLKPSNVMVTKAGSVKVLDFGLAKLREEIVQIDETKAADRLTGQGQIVGTVAYMSPEQASGAALDHRSDLFALGVILYQMATGARPFRGESGVAVLASILKDAPTPISDARPELPREFTRIVRRALAKDPEQRYQTAKDIRNDLQALQEDLKSGELTAPAALTSSGRGNRALAGALLATAVIAAAMFVAYLLMGRRPAGDRSDAMTISRLTATGKATLAAISPDGKYVVHVVSDGGHSLWIRQVSTSSNVQIVPPGPEPYYGLTFSNDGEYVYFTRRAVRLRSDTYRVPALGGTAELVARDVDSPVTFSRDGSRYAFVRGYPQRGEMAVMLSRLASSDPPAPLALRKWAGGATFNLASRLAWSPDDRTIAAAVGVIGAGGSLATVVLIDVATGHERPFQTRRWDVVGGMTWVDGGRALIVSAIETGRANFQLWKIAASDGAVTRVTNDLNNYEDVSITENGSTLATVLGDWSSKVSVSAAGQPASLRPVTTGQGRYDGLTGLAWTPEGRIVMTSSAGGQLDLWIMDADGKNLRQLTSTAEAELQPCATSDGKSVVFVTTIGGRSGIWLKNLDMEQPRQLTDNANDMLPLCGADAGTILFTRPAPEPRLHRLPTTGGPPSIASEVGAGAFAISADGRQVASMMRDEQSRWVIGVHPLDGMPPTGLFDITTTPMIMQFTPSGDALTFVDLKRTPAGLWNQPLSGGAPQLLVDMHGDQVFAFAWSRDGRLAVAHGPVPKDVVLISGISR